MTDLVHASQNSYSFSVVSCHKEHISDLLLPSLGIESGKLLESMITFILSLLYLLRQRVSVRRSEHTEACRLTSSSVF